MTTRQRLQVFSVQALEGTDFESYQGSRATQQVVRRRMVGHDGIRRSVQAMVLSLVKGGQSSMLVVEGSPGAGKTCLLNHLINDEEYEGHLGSLHIFQASGNPAFKSIPLYPWRSILTVRPTSCALTARHGKASDRLYAPWWFYRVLASAGTGAPPARSRPPLTADCHTCGRVPHTLNRPDRTLALWRSQAATGEPPFACGCVPPAAYRTASMLQYSSTSAPAACNKQTYCPKYQPPPCKACGSAEGDSEGDSSEIAGCAAGDV